MRKNDFPSGEFRLEFTFISLPYSYKMMAIETFKKRNIECELSYFLPYVFIHMQLENMVYNNFATILYSSRAEISSTFKYGPPSSTKCKKLIKSLRSENLEDKLDKISDEIAKIITTEDTKLLMNSDRQYLRHLIQIRNYLIHAKSTIDTLMRVAGRGWAPLQELNTIEDLIDAFKIMFVLEMRLTSAQRHIESTLYDCVWNGIGSIENSKIKSKKSFKCYVYRSPKKRYKAVTCELTFPFDRISRMAEKDYAFLRYSDFFYPVSNFEPSIKDAIKKANEYLFKECSEKDGEGWEISKFTGKKCDPNHPLISKNDWPLEKYPLESEWTENQIISHLFDNNKLLYEKILKNI